MRQAQLNPHNHFGRWVILRPCNTSGVHRHYLQQLVQDQLLSTSTVFILGKFGEVSSKFLLIFIVGFDPLIDMSGPSNVPVTEGFVGELTEPAPPAAGPASAAEGGTATGGQAGGGNTPPLAGTPQPAVGGAAHPPLHQFRQVGLCARR